LEEAQQDINAKMKFHMNEILTDLKIYDVSFLYQLTLRLSTQKHGTFPLLARQYEGKCQFFGFDFHVSFTVKGCKLGR